MYGGGGRTEKLADFLLRVVFSKITTLGAFGTKKRPAKENPPTSLAPPPLHTRVDRKMRMFL